MTTNTEHDNLIALAQKHLAHRLYGLARRTETMSVDTMLEMHRHLDTFRDEQKDKLRLPASDA
ncbi:hypothetical protein [Oerskovia merdavium]|uniref:Uncharacterized protein n=1 Tax=Oerskovia merdavium TaxID=2762227 RepID=A0ABR8TX26_9CELL|nr:hypothetical protein [Oerskovia merdavium]MBD7980040.1 hypothetical protein [Oerskovia merdavium]